MGDRWEWIKNTLSDQLGNWLERQFDLFKQMTNQVTMTLKRKSKSRKRFYENFQDNTEKLYTLYKSTFKLPKRSALYFHNNMMLPAQLQWIDDKIQEKYRATRKVLQESQNIYWEDNRR